MSERSGESRENTLCDKVIQYFFSQTAKQTFRKAQGFDRFLLRLLRKRKAIEILQQQVAEAQGSMVSSCDSLWEPLTGKMDALGRACGCQGTRRGQFQQLLKFFLVTSELRLGRGIALIPPHSDSSV